MSSTMPRVLYAILVTSLTLVHCYDKRLFDLPLPSINFTTQAGANISIPCPGITEQSLVQELEWRLYESGDKLVHFMNVVSIWNRDRVSLVPDTYALNFHPVTAKDSSEYVCLFNSRPKPEAIIKLFVLDVPDPPGKPLVSIFTSRSANLSWARPQDTHHSSISHYIIQTRVGENGNWNEDEAVLTKTNDTFYHMTKLHPFTVYSFRVFAVNSMGMSQASKPSYYMVTLREIPAGKPTITTAHNTSATAIHISWRAPHQDTIHGEFLGYRIAYRPRDKGPDEIKDVYVRDNAVESYTIHNLETYTQYLVSLQVFNPEGQGPSTTVLVMTDEGGKCVLIRIYNI